MDARLEKLIPHAMTAALIGHDLIRRRFGKQQNLISKGGVDAATDTDLEAERLAHAYLKRTSIPSYGEEYKGTLSPDLQWILDKIDGTPNFHSGIPLFGSGAGLIDGDTARLSAVFLPMFNQLYIAADGQGTSCFSIRKPGSYSYCRELWNNRDKAERCSTLHETNPKKVQVATDYGYIDRHKKLMLEARYANTFFYCPSYGSATYSLSQVAAGRLGGYVILGVGLHDILTASLLVSEAGGVVTDARGRKLTRNSTDLVAAANTSLHTHLITKIRK